jgi:hypothetical protein
MRKIPKVQTVVPLALPRFGRTRTAEPQRPDLLQWVLLATAEKVTLGIRHRSLRSGRKGSPAVPVPGRASQLLSWYRSL